MTLRVLHRTRYDYSVPVKESLNEARLAPFSADGQVCEDFRLKILPAGKLRHYYDFYRNQVHFFEVNSPHAALTVEAISEVTTSSARVLAPETITRPRGELAACIQLSQCYDFLQGTSYVGLTPEIWRLALDVVGDEPDIWAMAHLLMNYVHQEFRYDPDSTNVHTRLPEVLQDRRGVCQDFAHVLLGLCRSVKIPARYVSGYLYNGPADQLRGAQGSHAWVEVYLPEFGWRGLDPTNRRQPDDHYVKVAHGRDYADVQPLRGHYKGSGTQKLSVEVLVERR